MATGKVDALKEQIRDALQCDEFQKAAAGMTATMLPAAIESIFKRRAIRVSLISVGPAAKAAVADYAAVWQSSVSPKPETNWFSLRRR